MTTDIVDTIKTTELTAEQGKKLSAVVAAIPDILAKTDNSLYDEIFGYRINVDTAEHVEIPARNEILLKFLIANEYDVEVTKEKLVDTLNWRNEFRPLQAAFEDWFPQELSNLGVITNFKGEDNLNVITWNLYGNLKSPKKLFEKFGGEDNKSSRPGSTFLRWRVGLMEKSLQLIDVTDATNHKIGQIHDYNNVSMLRMDPGMKAATKEIIQIFGDNYPELLSTKFFINVPSLMSWVFTFFRKVRVISEETLKKFKVLNSGNLSPYLDASELPKEYSGTKDVLVLDLEDKSIVSPAYYELLKQTLGNQEIAAINDEVE